MEIKGSCYCGQVKFTAVSHTAILISFQNRFALRPADSTYGIRVQLRDSLRMHAYCTILVDYRQLLVLFLYSSFSGALTPITTYLNESVPWRSMWRRCPHGGNKILLQQLNAKV